jgi:hypothetical protein
MKNWIEKGTSVENWDVNWSSWSINIGTNASDFNTRMLEEGRFIISPRTGQEVEAEAKNNQNLDAKYREIATLAIMNNTVDRSFAEWITYFNANGGRDIYEQVRKQYRD